MLDHVDCEEVLGTSPPSRSNLAEGSELFRTVMEDFIQEHQLHRNTNSEAAKANAVNDIKTTSNLCRRCLQITISCTCKSVRSDKRVSVHRVQWADEMCDGPLVKELEIDRDSPLSCSPPSELSDSLKPILKHKANCIIIVAE